MHEGSSPSRIRVWDLPTRLFHWALTLCFVGLIATGTLGGSAMVFHFRFGYAVLTLLLFRLVWGLVGVDGRAFRAFFSGLQRCGVMSVAARLSTRLATRRWAAWPSW